MIDNDIAVLRDYIQRSTHWQEGGATRHDAIQAMKRLDKSAAALNMAEILMRSHKEAISHLDKVLNGCKTHAEQQEADAQARAFLALHGE